MPCKRESLHGVDGLFCFQRYVSCDELRNLVRKYALMDFNVYPQLARWWAEKSHHMYVEGPTEKFGHYVSNGTVGYTWYAYAIIFCFNIFAVIYRYIEPSRLAEITFFATSHSDIQYVYISKSTIFNVRPPETKGFWNFV